MNEIGSDLSCDVAIIGAGTAGLAAHKAATDEGARAVLIESGPYGTTCARTGCMPSKLLIAAARAAHDARRADLFGVHAAPVTIDGRAVMERLRRERDHFVSGVLEDVAKIPAELRIAGRARFAGPSRLVLDDGRTIAAGAIVIATGARTSIPPALEDLGDRLLTNESVFDIADLPRSLGVIGAGPLGIELAQAFSRLGVAVTVFDKGGVVAGIKDPAVAKAARAILERELDLRLGVEVTGERDGEGVRLSWHGSSGSDECRVDRVLVAAGRAPNVADLDPSSAGLQLDDRGTPVFDRGSLQCGTGAIFIAGDADHDRPVLHEAAREGRIAGRNAACFPQVERFPRGTNLAITFTDPEIATVGSGWPGEAPDLVVGEADLSRSGRARAMGVDAGLLRLYARRSDAKLVGAEMVGPEVEHLAHLVAWLIQLDQTAASALALPFYHPTLEESLRTAMRDVCRKGGSGGASQSFYLGVI